MIYEENCYYHLYNRGCNKDLIFREEQDYQKFLQIIKESDMRDYLELYAFSFMPNHYHFLVKQISATPVSKWIQFIFNRYVKFFNKKYERSGTLFESKVKGKKIDKPEYLENIIHYIHNNPDSEFLKKQSSLRFLNEGMIINREFYNEFFGRIEQYFQEFKIYQKSKKDDIMEDYLFHGKQV